MPFFFALAGFFALHLNSSLLTIHRSLLCQLMLQDLGGDISGSGNHISGF